MIIHPRAVREAGSANNALVLVRMTWRCEELTSSTWQSPDGRLWWVAPHSEIASETGMTVEQVRHSLKQLRAAKLVDEIELGRGRPRGYAPAGRVSEANSEPSDISDTLPSDDSQTPSEISDTKGMGVSDISDSLLLIEQSASGGEYESTTASTNRTTEMFESAWLKWPRKDNKKKAREKFSKLKNQAEVASAITSFGEAYAKGATEFVPHLITWLNGERWNDPLPAPKSGQGVSTVAHGREVDRILREREQSAKELTYGRP